MIWQNLSKKIFAVILSFLQMLVLNVSYGDYTEPEKEETQLVNDISGDTSLADSIKSTSETSSEADTYYIEAERSAYATENTEVKFC